MMKEISPDRKRTADQRSGENGQDGCMMKDAGHPQGLSTGIRSFAVIKERGCAKASLFLVALRKTLYNTEVSDNGKNRGNVMKTLSILSARMLARALSLIKRGGSLPGQIAVGIAPPGRSKQKYL